ncbi:AraC family transcriptional regulator [Spongiibacter nanhainus]|uniref:AraC family transcriptional regulator n=1 Tax=Spongiibacter nanhainus TaxID=2794344 RepID=A0A7T4R2Y2_9GAMM|nr:AraC family transcriptional regulator [Spongiibacter nanhainus]QQD19495.1 AraC family transcriptional regulator [Spongiibacter nanhainus]
MTETLFAFDERNYHECQQAFRGENNQEYYLGDYRIEAGSVIDVRADKKSVGACSIIRLQSKTKLFFRRSWTHIREDATDVMVLWFVRSGLMRIMQDGATHTAGPGNFVITKSMTPFTIECLTDNDARHEVLHVIVPAHVFRRFLPHEIRAGIPLQSSKPAFGIAERVFTDLFNDGEALSERVEKMMLETALTVLADTLENHEDCTQQRQSLSELRYQEVLRFVEIHLCDPKLNAAMVAEACGISQRYLSHLLKQRGSSFSTLVWEWRLKVAHQWLSTTSPKEISIAEIAFRVGFKSPAHFSRLFKRVYGVGPREYRSGAKERETATQSQPGKAEFFINGSTALQ